jgi:hypothetical protein
MAGVLILFLLITNHQSLFMNNMDADDLVGLLEAVNSWPLAISYNQELFCQQPMAISQ